MTCRTGRREGCGGPGWNAVAMGAICAALLLGSAVVAGETAGNGPAFEVSAFELSYGSHAGHPGLPSTAELLRAQMTLGKVADGYVAVRPGVASVTIQLSAPPKPGRFYASAIQSISRQMLALLNARGIGGVFVAPDPKDIVEQRSRKGGKVQVTLKDRRPANRKALRIVIWTGVVTEVRTLASGNRVATDERVNNSVHAWIREQSPVSPAVAGQAVRTDLLRRDELERYIYWLSRHPGRRVDLALSSSDKPGGVVLDYLVSENKPWYAYVQASNTGTKATEDWRERFGFVHNQFTGRDDVLTIDYTTAGFDAAHALYVSYEAPFFKCPRVRWRVYGSYGEYEASDVGMGSQDFEGATWMGGAELIGNVYQNGRFFIDAVGGVRYEDISVKDKLVGSKGDAELLVPYVGFRFERLTETMSTWGSVILEVTERDITNTSKRDLQGLGRFDPSGDWAVLKFNAQHSFYIEPLLNTEAWKDPATFESSTLAHEMYFSVRGQTAFGGRLIPQHEQTVGGFYSVRGYPESVLAGDDAYIATAEYRFHLPRIFKPRPPTKMPLFGTPFKFAPQQVYGRPDWDLMARFFYDVGRAVHNKCKVYEHDFTIQGIGAGLELRYKTHVTLRVDYAVALEDVDKDKDGDHDASSGDNRFHAVFTFAF